MAVGAPPPAPPRAAAPLVLLALLIRARPSPLGVSAAPSSAASAAAAPPPPPSASAATAASASASPSPPSPALRHPDPDPDVDWDSLGFGLNGIRTDAMWLDRVSAPSPAPPSSDGGAPSSSSSYSLSPPDCVVPLGPLPLHPASTVLNYGQSLFEGLKAFRRYDGTVALFRPDRNARRMMDGARRLLLPPVPTDAFLLAADEVVRANARWVPPFGRGALYLRPLLFGSGEGLGVKPSREGTFCVYASPVGDYFRGGLRAISLQAVGGQSRAAPGGSGSVKAGGNYAPPFLVQRSVRERGYDEALFLDAVSGEAIEEAGASNFFAVFPNNTIVTPPLSAGTILPGVTRESVMELARRECGCDVREARLTLSDLGGASEAFCCGTGAGITPVGRVGYHRGGGGGGDGDGEGAGGVGGGGADGPSERDHVFGDGESAGPLTERLYGLLRDIQMGTGDEDLCRRYRDWIRVVEAREDRGGRLKSTSLIGLG